MTKAERKTERKTDRTYEMRLCGSGGQGVILASIILAEAAVINGSHTVQSQAYGPEARGGLCKAEVIISHDDIRFPKVVRPNFLLALTQESLDCYARNLADDCVILADDSLTIPADAPRARIIQAPIIATATRKVGSARCSNIVALGAINAALQLFSDEILEQAVKMHIPAGTETVNLNALHEGEKLIYHDKD